MANGLIGRKIGMTQIFDEEGHTVPVTVVEAGPCYVTQVKTVASDGYDAIQLGFEAAQPRKLKQPQRGHLKDLPFLRHLREWRVRASAEYEVGQKLDVSIFEPGERVSVTGTSKGKGLSGCGQAPRFSRGAADARAVGPPAGARLDWLWHDPQPRAEGAPDAWTDGWRPRDGAQSLSRPRRPGAQPAAVAWCRSRPARGLAPD